MAVDGWAVTIYIWYSEEGPGRAGAPPSPLLATPNVTAHPSTASVATSYYSMWNYTVSQKNGAPFISTVTLTNVGRF